MQHIYQDWKDLLFSVHLHSASVFPTSTDNCFTNVIPGHCCVLGNSCANVIPSHCWPNVVVEWLTILLCVRKVPGSNFGLETGYTDLRFSCFSSSHQANSGIVGYLKIRPQPLPSKFFPIRHLLITYYSTLNSLSYWKGRSKIKYKWITTGHCCV
jgi:hypothetical protein